MCSQKRGFLPKIWLYSFRRDLHAVPILRLRRSAALTTQRFLGHGPCLHLTSALAIRVLSTDGGRSLGQGILISKYLCFVFESQS